MSERRAILFIEDEALIRELVAPVLADAGFQVEAAARAEDALLLFRRRIADFCAVVTDVNLGPGLTGWELARLIRELASDIPIVYVTGNPQEFEAHAVSNSILFPKPYDAEEVASILRVLVESGASPSKNG